jgi:hypothetical protein
MAAADLVPAAADPGRRGFLTPWIRRTMVTVPIVAALGLAAVPWFCSQPDRVSKFVAEAVPELQADVKFGSVKLGWAGPITLENVSVVPRDGGKPPVTIKRIQGSHGLAAILLSAGDLGRLTVEGLEADVEYDTEGRSNFATLVRRDDGPEGKAGPPRHARRSPLRMELNIADARVRVSGPWADEPWTSAPINVQARLAAAEDGPWSEWTIEPVQLLADARLEPGVARGMLAYIAPVLADTTRTSGRFSLRIEEARLPVGEPAAGRLAGTLAMHEVVVGPGPLVTSLFQSLPGRLPPPPAIVFADEANVKFRLADRRVWHEGLEFGLPLAKPGQRLDVRSSGSVGIDDKSLDLKLALPIPGDLPADRPLLAALAGKTVSVGIGGMLGKPEVKFDGSIKATAGDVVADLLQGAGGNGSTAESVADLVGGLLQEAAKRRAERQAAEAASPEAPPSRRGRILRRFGQPPPAADERPAERKPSGDAEPPAPAGQP